LIGLEVEVVNSPNEAEIGLRGKVVLDKKNALVILSEDNKKKVILKKNRVFKFKRDGKIFIIDGDAIIGKYYSRI